MKSTETLSSHLGDPALTYEELVRQCCRIAEDLEHRGQYEAARNALTDLWQGVGQRPNLKGLSELTAAEVLLRVGSLSGWFVHARQLDGLQEAAKNLITEGITRLEVLDERGKTAAAFCELAIFYRRAGAHSDARAMYEEALSRLTDEDIELKATILLRLAVADACSGRSSDALGLLTDAASLFKKIANHVLQGNYHNNLGNVLTILSKAECRQAYTDRAILEYTEAAYHFEQAGHARYRAHTENNLGFVLSQVGRYEEAHECLNRARQRFLSLEDCGSVAQVDETTARVLLREGRPRKAAKVIGDAVRALSKGGEQASLAEALTTQGRVLACLNDFVGSQNKFLQAADVAEQAGALEHAGKALLTLIEEHADWLAESALLEAYCRADDLLKKTQDAETLARLRACARRLIAGRRDALPTKPKRSDVDFWANFSLAEQIHAYEARYIKRALIEAKGSVSRAARLLGFKHHASFVALLRGRHKSLAHLRTTPSKRRRSILRLRGGAGLPKAAGKRARAVKILYAEDDKLVADAVVEVLKLEGWRVELLSNGEAVLSMLTGAARYDLLLLDNELPGRSGLELVRAARELEHRRRTPVVMLSASDVKAEAERAGVDAFLRKPEGVGELVATITRLLAAGKK